MSESVATSMYKWRQSKREELAARVAKFSDPRPRSGVPSAREEEFKGILASALEQAQAECDCETVGAWVDFGDDCYVSTCSLRNDLSEGERYLKALTASGIDVTDFTHFQLQRKDAILASVHSDYEYQLRRNRKHTLSQRVQG